jgi:hypothetical protein
MKNLGIIHRAVVAFAMVAALGVAPSAAQAAAVNATASITAVPAISVVLVQNLNFANIVAGATAGTVSVPVTGTNVRTSTGGVVLGNAGSVMVAKFMTHGAALTSFSITVPTTASLTGPGAAMTLDGFTVASPTGSTNVDGDFTFNVGATLNVNALQATGAYTTTFPVTVAYN